MMFAKVQVPTSLNILCARRWVGAEWCVPANPKALPGGCCGLSKAFFGIMTNAWVDPCYTKPGKNKVPGKSFHSFRHTMVANLDSRQIAENVRMRMVGHANANVHRIYSHDDWSAITSAINGLPGLSA